MISTEMYEQRKDQGSPTGTERTFRANAPQHSSILKSLRLTALYRVSQSSGIINKEILGRSFGTENIFISDLLSFLVYVFTLMFCIVFVLTESRAKCLCQYRQLKHG
jgi:hypothetical protein